MPRCPRSTCCRISSSRLCTSFQADYVISYTLRSNSKFVFQFVGLFVVCCMLCGVHFTAFSGIQYFSLSLSLLNLSPRMCPCVNSNSLTLPDCSCFALILRLYFLFSQLYSISSLHRILHLIAFPNIKIEFFPSRFHNEHENRKLNV